MHSTFVFEMEAQGMTCLRLYYEYLGILILGDARVADCHCMRGMRWILYKEANASAAIAWSSRALAQIDFGNFSSNGVCFDIVHYDAEAPAWGHDCGDVPLQLP
jgi:hypothetical protein